MNDVNWLEVEASLHSTEIDIFCEYDRNQQEESEPKGSSLQQSRPDLQKDENQRAKVRGEEIQSKGLEVLTW